MRKMKMWMQTGIWKRVLVCYSYFLSFFMMAHM